MTDATATVIVAAIVGLPATIAAVVAALNSRSAKAAATKTQEDVGKIEKHTNGMIAKLEQSAKREGGAEMLTSLGAGSAPLPVTISPVANDPKIAEWIKMGIEIEKARREKENGVKEP